MLPRGINNIPVMQPVLTPPPHKKLQILIWSFQRQQWLNSKKIVNAWIYGVKYRLSKDYLHTVIFHCVLPALTWFIYNNVRQAQERCHVTVSQPINLQVGELSVEQELFVELMTCHSHRKNQANNPYVHPANTVFYAPTLTPTKKIHRKLQLPEQRKNPQHLKILLQIHWGRGVNYTVRVRHKKMLLEGALWCLQTINRRLG